MQHTGEGANSINIVPVSCTRLYMQHTGEGANSINIVPLCMHSPLYAAYRRGSWKFDSKSLAVMVSRTIKGTMINVSNYIYLVGWEMHKTVRTMSCCPLIWQYFLYWWHLAWGYEYLWVVKEMQWCRRDAVNMRYLACPMCTRYTYAVNGFFIITAYTCSIFHNITQIQQVSMIWTAI